MMETRFVTKPHTRQYVILLVVIFALLFTAGYATTENSTFRVVYADKTVIPENDKTRVELVLRVTNKTDNLFRPLVGTEFYVTTDMRDANGYLVIVTKETANELNRLISAGKKQMIFINGTVSADSYDLGNNVIMPYEVIKNGSLQTVKFQIDAKKALFYIVVKGQQGSDYLEIRQKNNYLSGPEYTILKGASE